MSHALARSTYPILLPAIEQDLLDNHQQSGLLTTVNYGAYMAGVAVVTTISGRFEPARMLRLGLVAATVGFATLAAATGIVTLAIGQALAGLGSAGIWMTAPTIATAAVPTDRRGTVMGLMSSTMGLGVIAASQGTRLVRVAAEDDQLWRPTWVGGAIYAGLLTVAILALLRTPTTAQISGGVSLSRLRAVPAWLPLTIGYFLFGLVVSSFTPFFGAALEEADFSRSHIANLYSLFGLAAVFGAVTLGRMSDRIGRRPVLLGALAGMAVASLLVLIASEPFATIAAVVFGAASFTYPVLTVAHLSDHLQDRAFGNALGALTLIYGVALLIGPFVSGTIGDSRLGFPAVFAGTAAAALAATVFIRQLPAERSAVPATSSAAGPGAG